MKTRVSKSKTSKPTTYNHVHDGKFIGPIQQSASLFEGQKSKLKEVVIELNLVQQLESRIKEATLTNDEIDSLMTLLKSKKTTSYKQPMNIGVGAFIRQKIVEGLGNKDILKLVHEYTGNTNTTYACVAWYRNNLKSLSK